MKIFIYMKFLLRRNFLFLIVGLFSFSAVQSQSQYSNLEKYWKYRERLREKFVYVSDSVENFGVNLPAVKINYDDTASTLGFGDNNVRSAFYLSLLSTELYLLKENGENYSETLKELYYALLAIERLDLYSETYEQVAYDEGWIQGSDWDDSKIDVNDLNINNINGYFIRDDVTLSFWDKYSSYFGFDDFISHINREPGIFFMEPISQDNIFNLLQGLALIEALVGVEDVSSNPAVFNTSIIPTYLFNKNIKNGNSIDFAEWARDLTLRLTKYMQPSLNFSVPQTWVTWFLNVFVSDWYLVDSRGELVPEGNGLLELGAFFHWPIIDNAIEVTGLPESVVRDNEGELFGLSVYKESFEDGSTPVFGVLMDSDFNWGEEKEQKTRSLGALADILHGIITLDALRDLRDGGYHIAITTIYKVNVLASWNFKHIVNLDKIRMYNSVNLKKWIYND
ncbi:MAG TPA: hypothetical protein VJ951_06930 [Bacteroidales bacterium]|nr:hypothetical protein [Bacteroidales bacterium]